MDLQKTTLKKKPVIRRKFLMKANMKCLFCYTIFTQKQVKWHPLSRNIEESIWDKKQDSDKDNILNAFFVIKLLQKHMSNDIS